MRRKLLPIFLVNFLDNFSFIFVFPLFAILIFTPEFKFVPFYESFSSRTTLLGLLNASFPLAVFFGAPIMGNLSDRYGRKKILFVTLLATIAANLFTALALHVQSYFLVFLSRIFCGFFSANLALCLAAISDLSHNEEIRSKNFGTLTAVSGLSRVLAMFAGSYISFQVVDPTLSPSLCFIGVAGIGAISLIILVRYFPETHKVKEHPLNLRLSSIWNDISHAFRTRHLRSLFTVQCLFLFGWLLIFQWFTTYSIIHFELTRGVIVFSRSIVGLFWISGATLFNRYLIKHVSIRNIPRFGLILLTLLLTASSFVSDYFVLVSIDCLIALTVSFTAANLFNLISLSAKEAIQGKVMGLSQSVITIAQFSSPLFGSMIPVQNVPLLYRIAAMATLIALSVFHREKFKPSIK